MTLPALPAENEDPWFEKRNAFDVAVKTDLEGRLSDAALSATIGAEIHDAQGVWVDYTPTVSGMTLGNATVTGRYLRQGAICFVVTQIVWGSTSVMLGPTVAISLPVNASRLPMIAPGGMMTDAGVTTVTAFITSQPGALSVWGWAAGAAAVLSPTAPFAWSVGDKIEAWATYEVPAVPQAKPVPKPN